MKKHLTLLLGDTGISCCGFGTDLPIRFTTDTKLEGVPLKMSLAYSDPKRARHIICSAAEVKLMKKFFERL